MAPLSHPGSPTAFEALVDHYDAARPTYPKALYDALPDVAGTVLELGAGTGIAARELVKRGGYLVCTDLGPKMLGRLHELLPEVPVFVARAEAMPFADDRFDVVCGGQLWHWVRDYRASDYGAQLAPYFVSVEHWTTRWERMLDWPAYERWLQSKSYVQAIDDVGAFIAVERASLAGAFPDGRIVEPFTVSLWIARKA